MCKLLRLVIHRQPVILAPASWRRTVLSYLTRLTGRDREEFYDDHLAHFLTFIAGAANAGGFMAFQRYTSHMTGIASASADALAIGEWQLFLA